MICRSIRTPKRKSGLRGGGNTAGPIAKDRTIIANDFRGAHYSCAARLAGGAVERQSMISHCPANESG